MDTVSEGKIIVDGREISSYKEKDMTLYQKMMLVVFQFYNLVKACLFKYQCNVENYKITILMKLQILSD